MDEVSEHDKALLEQFARFLEAEGYLDADWRTEPPYAIDRFLAEREVDAH